jgi:hypothetical protein
MNAAVRLIVSFITLAATFIFFWLAFSFVLAPGPARWLRPFGSLACAILITQYVSRRTGSSSGGLIKCMCLSGFATGVIGFSAGFLWTDNLHSRGKPRSPSWHIYYRAALFSSRSNRRCNLLVGHQEKDVGTIKFNQARTSIRIFIHYPESR